MVLKWVVKCAADVLSITYDLHPWCYGSGEAATMKVERVKKGSTPKASMSNYKFIVNIADSDPNRE